MSTIVHVSHFPPEPIGGGGHHRCYQIHRDCVEVMGARDVVSLYIYDLPRRVGGIPGEGKRILRFRKNPVKLLTRTEFSPWRFTHDLFLRHYQSVIRSRSGPTAVILEHAGFFEIANWNRHQGIPTIICPQNLESFDEEPLVGRSGLRTRAHLLDFASELEVYRRCEERLFISPIESAFMNGLGLESRLYEYHPAGEIADHLGAIRLRRSRGGIKPEQFLILGTARHHSMRDGMKWVLECVRQEGLPEGINIIFAGLDTERLGKSVPGVTLCDWVDQNHHDELLATSCTVLAPSFIGMGAPTKLSELALAGVPVLVSRHLLSMVAGNGVGLGRDWGHWRDAMIRTAAQQRRSPIRVAVPEQPTSIDTLKEVLQRILGRGA